mgnify:CR=1 FL=1
MPELPEVETIKNQLNQKIKNATIIKVRYSDVIGSIIKQEFPSLIGKKISHFERHCKVLLVFLDKTHVIQSGLGMSGSWRIWDKITNVPHTHMTIECKLKNKKNIYLAYVDPRRFGKMHYFSLEEWKEKKQKMGVDVSGPNFTIEYLEYCLKKYPDRMIKPYLLDQKFFGGIGNYIACEICARAGIKPQRRCKNIRKYEYPKILEATRSVLEGQIKRNGLTFSGGYSDTTGEKGNGIQDLVVFHQEICGLCHQKTIKKINLSQRGTYYCKECQK